MNEKLIHFIKRFGDINIDESRIVRIGRNYFFTDPELKKISDSIKRDIYATGVYVGEEKNFFEPSSEFIEMLSKYLSSEKLKIFVNKKAEWLFLCGRSILPESISKNPNNISEGLVFVQNELDENLGYGLFQKQGKDLIVKNLLDKGAYLRMNEKGRKK
jgi:ribosome biogenesis protein Nip4